MLTGSSAIIKYLLFIFNFIFVITGIAILSVGAVIQSEYTQYEDLLNQNYFSTPGLLIAIGVIIFIVAFFGCCGSIKENYCMMLTFATLMIMIFILELAAGIAGYVLRDSAESVLKANMMDSMKYYNQVPSALWSKNEWDTLQNDLHCCGTDGPLDWVNKADFNETYSHPESCCSSKVDCSMQINNYTNVYTTGCLSVLGDVIRAHAVTLGGAGIGIAFVQLFGVILSCSLAKGIKQGYETV